MEDSDVLGSFAWDEKDGVQMLEGCGDEGWTDAKNLCDLDPRQRVECVDNHAQYPPIICEHSGVRDARKREHQDLGVQFVDTCSSPAGRVVRRVNDESIVFGIDEPGQRGCENEEPL